MAEWKVSPPPPPPPPPPLTQVSRRSAASAGLVLNLRILILPFNSSLKGTNLATRYTRQSH